MKDFFYQNIKPLESTVERFPWEKKKAYAEFLAQSYYYVAHSTRLLAASASRFPIEQVQLFNRFTVHISEERSHEVLAVRDLKKLGYELSAFDEMPLATVFYESQYFKIEHQDPTALLGYIIGLEGISVRKMKQVYERLVNAYGKEAATFIHLHAQEDDDHLEKAFKQISTLNPTQVDLIKKNMIQTISLYGMLLNEIVTCTEFSVTNLPVARLQP